MSPAIAVLGPPRREREDVIGGIANGMQDRAVFDREGLSQLFWRGTQEATSPQKKARGRLNASPSRLRRRGVQRSDRRQKDRGGLAPVPLVMSGHGPPLFRNADELCLDEGIVRLLGALFALQRPGAVLVGLTRRHGMPHHYANAAT